MFVAKKWSGNNSLLWLRWLVTAGVLLLAPAIGYLFAPDYATHILLALVGLCGALVLVQILAGRPGLGLLLLIPVSLLIPFSIGTGTETGLNATILFLALLLALWGYEMLQGNTAVRLHESPTIPPLLLLLAVTVLAFIVGQMPWFQGQRAPLSAQLGALGVFLMSAGAFLLAAHQYRELRWLEWTVWTFIILGAGYVGFRVIPGLFRYSGLIYQWGSTSSPFWTWLVALIFSQALLNGKLHKVWRVALWVILGATLYTLFVQTADWKSGWFPPLVVIATIVTLRSWQAGLFLIPAAILLVPGLSAWLIASDEYSYSTRLDAWLILLEMIKVNPILGLGPANYYYYTLLFGIRGYSVRFNSHNQYFDMLLQTGVLGLLCLLWFFAAVARVGWNLREQAPDGFARAYVYGALGGLAGTVASGLLGDWILPFVYNVGLVGLRSSILAWLFLGALVALGRMMLEGEIIPDDHGKQHREVARFSRGVAPVDG